MTIATTELLPPDCRSASLRQRACALLRQPTRPAAGSIREELSEAVAAAALELLTGDLLTHPRRVGKPLQRDLAVIRSARRGSYRVLLTIDDEARVIIVLAVEHRRDAYRRR